MALNALKEQLRFAGESPSVTATKWRDQLLAAGLTAAQGRRAPKMPYVTINPVEFSDLTLAGPHAENARGEIVFYDVRISGSDLWNARRAVSADMASVELKPAGASSHLEDAAPQDSDRESETLRSVAPTTAGKKNEDAIRRRGAYRGPLDA